MRIRFLFVALLLVLPGVARPQTLWDYRDPRSAYYFHDYRARNIGDVLTIVIDENTGADAQETRDLDKQTKATGSGTAAGSSSSLGTVLRSFAGDINLTSASQRTFGGKANTMITRNFSDRLSVIVIDVMPNGNLVVQGTRQRMIAREMRTLRVTGVVRPADIGPFNTVQSQYLANVFFTYLGRGPESSYMNNGWGGRIMNKLWPF